jgi:hypothetical protein
MARTNYKRSSLFCCNGRDEEERFCDWLEVDGVGGKIENDGQQKETDSGTDPVKLFTVVIYKCS